MVRYSVSQELLLPLEVIPLLAGGHPRVQDAQALRFCLLNDKSIDAVGVEKPLAAWGADTSNVT